MLFTMLSFHINTSASSPLTHHKFKNFYIMSLLHLSVMICVYAAQVPKHMLAEAL